jgi:hypothetical protein
MLPTRSKYSVLKQVLTYIPRNLVSSLSRQHDLDKKARTFSVWSHVVSMVFSQLAHTLSLNDLCDNLHNHSAALSTVRGATPPSRNGLSHANRTRNANFAEDLFWQVLGSLQGQFPKFGIGFKHCGFPKRFKRLINVVDSTTIQLVANCMDWAKHRRRKAAAKCHMLLDLESFLPKFAIVKSADTHDSSEARALCKNIAAGEIVLFDKAYIAFVHLYELTLRGVFWVSRAKDNMSYSVTKNMLKKPKKGSKILRDVRIKLKGVKSKAEYPQEFRLVQALVMVDNKEVEMTFITNNLEWSASSICDLYKARWSIEVFFKLLKQNLQLADFLGHNENAVRWQIWMALLTYVLLRFISYIGTWKGSFARLFTAIRGTLWNRFDLLKLLQFCGTANDPPRMCARVEQLFMPGIR